MKRACLHYVSVCFVSICANHVNKRIKGAITSYLSQAISSKVIQLCWKLSASLRDETVRLSTAISRGHDRVQWAVLLAV